MNFACDVMHPKVKTFPLIDPDGSLAWLGSSCAFILAANWWLQGVRGMDRKEWLFRFSLEALAAVILAGGMLHDGASPFTAWLVGLIVAHNLNFSFNGQFWVCARYCRFYRRPPAVVAAWRDRCFAEIAALPWLDEAVCIGSQARGGNMPTPRSDIDLRVFFAGGFVNWLRVNGLLLRLRATAFVGGIPLDLYAYERPDALGRFDLCEPVAIIVDRRGRLAGLLGRRGYRSFP